MRTYPRQNQKDLIEIFLRRVSKKIQFEMFQDDFEM